MQICHLLCTDETVIFCDANSRTNQLHQSYMVIFEAVSGLLVNWRKSSIFQVKEVANLQTLANILNYKIEDSQPPTWGFIWQ